MNLSYYLKRLLFESFPTNFGSASWSTNPRGGCKTTVPQKIDDFDASSQGQQAGPGRADETMPEWAGEEARREMALKGRFYGVHEFCNCLSSMSCEAESKSVKKPFKNQLFSNSERGS
jgi:hypothetical protein